MKILLVDDDASLLHMVEDMLTYEGFEVVLAQSGEDALARLIEMQPDLIILDIGMPGIGGLGFLRRMTEQNSKKFCPVLVFTARAELQSFFNSAIVAGFLAKPSTCENLLNTIRKILASCESGRGADAMMKN